MEGVLSQLGLSDQVLVVDQRQNQPRPSMHLHALTAASPQNPHSFNAQRGSWLEGPSHLHRLME